MTKFKKILNMLLLVVMILSPVLFAGCMSSGSSGSSSGGSGSSGSGSSGSGGSGSSSGDEQEYDITEFLNGVKMAYRSSVNGLENQQSAYYNITLLSYDLLFQLTGHYGLGNYGVSTKIGDETYYFADYTPFGNENITYTFMEGDTGSVDEMRFGEPITLTYTVNAQTTHANAIGNDYIMTNTEKEQLKDRTIEKRTWNWTWADNLMPEVNEQTKLTNDYTNIFKSAFSINYAEIHMKKMELALYLLLSTNIKSDITNASGLKEEFNVFLDKYRNYVYDDNGNVKADSEISSAIDDVRKNISHIGFLAEEKQFLKWFIAHEIIGSEVYENDTFKFYKDVIFASTDGYNIDPNETFNNEEYIFDIFTTNIDGEIDRGYATNYWFYNNGETTDENVLTHNPFEDLYLNGSKNGTFDYWGSNIVFGTPDTALNNLCSRGDYFKNYANTVSSIVEETLDQRIVADNDDGSEEFKKYPKVADLWVRDFSVEDIEPGNGRYGEDDPDFFRMGEQNYKSMTFLTKKDCAFAESGLFLVFESSETFEMNVMLRYHKASQNSYNNGYMMWNVNGVMTDFYPITNEEGGSIKVNQGMFDFNEQGGYVEIDVSTILKSGTFNSIQNADATISEFTNNTPAPIPVNLKMFPDALNYAKYFVFNKKGASGAPLVYYNDTSTDFIEIIFDTPNKENFSIGFFIVDLVNTNEI